MLRLFTGFTGAEEKLVSEAEKSSSADIKNLIKRFKEKEIDKDEFIKLLREYRIYRHNYDTFNNIRNSNVEDIKRDEAHDILEGDNKLNEFHIKHMLAAKFPKTHTLLPELNRSLGEEFGDLYFYNPFRFPMQYICNVPTGYSLAQWESHLHVTRLQYIMDEVVKFVNKDAKQNPTDWLELLNYSDLSSDRIHPKDMLAFFVGKLLRQHKIQAYRNDYNYGPNIVSRLLQRKEERIHAYHETTHAKESHRRQTWSRSSVLLANLSRYDAALFIIKAMESNQHIHLQKCIKEGKNIAVRNPTQFTLLSEVYKAQFAKIENQYGIVPKYVKHEFVKSGETLVEANDVLGQKQKLERDLMLKCYEIKNKQLNYVVDRFKANIKDISLNEEYADDAKQQAGKELLYQMISIGISPVGKEENVPPISSKYDFSFQLTSGQVKKMDEFSGSFDAKSLFTRTFSTRRLIKRRHTVSYGRKTKASSRRRRWTRGGAKTSRYGGAGSKIRTFENKHGLESFFDHMLSKEVKRSSFENAANALILQSYRDPHRLPKSTTLMTINPLMLYPRSSYIKANATNIKMFEEHWKADSNAKHLFDHRLKLSDEFYDLTLFHPFEYEKNNIDYFETKIYTTQQWLFHLRTTRYSLLLLSINKFIAEDMPKHPEDYQKLMKISRFQTHKVFEFLIDGYSGGINIVEQELEKLGLTKEQSDRFSSFRSSKLNSEELKEEEEKEDPGTPPPTIDEERKKGRAREIAAFRTGNVGRRNRANSHSGGGLLDSYLKENSPKKTLDHVESSMKNDIIGRLRRNPNMNLRLLFSRISDVDIASLILSCVNITSSKIEYTNASIENGLYEKFFDSLKNHMFGKTIDKENTKAAIHAHYINCSKDMRKLKIEYLYYVTYWYYKKKESYKTERERLSNNVLLAAARGNSVEKKKELQNLDKKMLYFFIACLQDHMVGLYLPDALGKPGEKIPELPDAINDGKTSRGRPVYNYALPFTWLPGDAFDTVYAF